MRHRCYLQCLLNPVGLLKRKKKKKERIEIEKEKNRKEKARKKSLAVWIKYFFSRRYCVPSLSVLIVFIQLVCDLVACGYV